MKELLEILQAMAARKDDVGDRLELFLDMAERVVKHVSGVFGTKGDEVAILVLTSDLKHLRFAAPRKFSTLGTIPVTKRDSIAVNILGRRAGEAMNNVPMVKHVAFFESVKLRDRPLGVAQISRKGETPAEAGPDFSGSDVQKAQEIFRAVGPILHSARPEKF
jgi:hypothetical protein